MIAGPLLVFFREEWNIERRSNYLEIYLFFIQLHITANRTSCTETKKYKVLIQTIYTVLRWF